MKRLLTAALISAFIFLSFASQARAAETLVTVPDKSTGQTLSATEFTQILDSIKSGTRAVKAQALVINGAKVYLATGLEGVSTGDLAQIPVATPSNGAMAIVILPTTGVAYLYHFDLSGTNAESVPLVIRPNDYSTAGVWKLATLPAEMVAGSGSMVYPGAGVPLSTGSAWGTSYTAGVVAGNLLVLPTDPAAHTLFGFDNTTNTYKPILIGANLTFTQATATLSATGTGSMVYPGAGVPFSTGSAWGTSYTLDTDLLSASANDDTVPSAKATKAYADTKQAADADIPTVSASQVEMETGTESALRSMSPLRVAQAIAVGAGLDTNGWDYTVRSTAPASPVAGKIYRANNEAGGWDPITYTGTTDYFVLYTGAAYIGIVDIDGNLLLSALLGDDTAYNAGTWDASTKPPTQNAVRDKFENLDTAKVSVSAVPWQRDIHISAPASTDVVRIRTTKAITLSAIGCIADPADSAESVVIDLQECNGDGDSCASVLSATITCANTNTTGTITDTAIAANVWLLIDLGTVTGTVSDLSIYIRGTEAQ